MRGFIGIALCAHLFSACAIAQEFDEVRALAQGFLIDAGVAASDIEDIHVGALSGGLPNSRNVERVADVAFRVRGQGTRYVQLFQQGRQWKVLRLLEANQLATAHPQLIDEYSEEHWRETARLQQRIAADLQARLVAEGKIAAVNFAEPRCFVDLNHSKALCDIAYATWDQHEPPCSSAARAFERRGEQWTEMPGDYHSGMRIDPDTGEIYTMIPQEDCEQSGGSAAG